MKRRWKRFNTAVNEYARCVLCKRYFEGDVFMCSKSHNLCDSCYTTNMKELTCGVDSCSGIWLSEQCRNLRLGKLSRLRRNLNAARENVKKWNEPPWEDLLVCDICKGELDDKD